MLAHHSKCAATRLGPPALDPPEGPSYSPPRPKQSTSLAFTFWRENPRENTRLKGHRRSAGVTDAVHLKQRGIAKARRTAR